MSQSNILLCVRHIHACVFSEYMHELNNRHIAAIDRLFIRSIPAIASRNKKLHYREEHSASIVVNWCTLWHLSETNSISTANQKPTEFREITQNNGNYNVQGHSRTPILLPIESPYTTSY